MGRCRCKCTACHIGWREGDRVAELLEPAHLVPCEANGIQAVEISGPEIGVGAAIAQQVVDHHEQRVRHRHQGAGGPTPFGEPARLRDELGVAGVGDRKDDCTQDGA